MAKKRAKEEPRVVGFLGVGFDNQDGHQRLTRSEHFFLVGGSEETHERMQDTAIKFGENLTRRGKKLDEATIEEILDIFHDSLD